MKEEKLGPITRLTWLCFLCRAPSEYFAETFAEQCRMLGCVGAVANDEENPAAESSPLIPQDEGLLDRSKIKRDFIIKVFGWEFGGRRLVEQSRCVSIATFD